MTNASSRRPIPTFEACFHALTGHKPMRWQARFFKRALAGDLPGVCDIPTGLGKTSVIPIWLIALASQSRDSCKLPLPRRLVYIVNRRTVVDQATEVVEMMRQRLRNPQDVRWDGHQEILVALKRTLQALAASMNEEVVGVSTLRGELADNEEWKADPARPAIVIGTIDMIGSKILFSGYGDGRYHRAHHAGLVGQDVLIVHDEAHLTPAFDDLLRSVAEEQARCAEARPIRVLRLSATRRAGSNGGTAVNSSFGIEEEDRQDKVVSQRLNAGKLLKIADTEKGRTTPRIAEEALRLGEAPGRVLVYVRTPDAAAAIATDITEKLGDNGCSRLALLTGTIRGHERDMLALGRVLAAFRPAPERTALTESLFLVSTSAGEVGADWDADHLVCDLTTLDSMAQRLGRVNRLGGKDGMGNHRSAEVVVVIENEAKGKTGGDDAGQRDDSGGKERKPRAVDPYEAAVLETGKILRRITDNGGDVSPAAIGKVISDEDKRVAFSPEPAMLLSTDILFDNWSLTSIAGELPGRPAVEPYLHGVAEWEPPETHVAWRADIAPLARAGVSEEDLEEVFETFSLRAAERLRDRTDRVFEQLIAIAQRLRNGANLPDEVRNPKVVLYKQSAFRWVDLSALTPSDKQRKEAALSRLAFATVILPVELGGLKRDGTLDGAEQPPGDPKTLDVADKSAPGQGRRQRVWINADESEMSLVGGSIACNLARRLRITLRDDEQAGGETSAVAIEYRVEKGEATEPGKAVTLSDHACTIEKVADSIGRAVGPNGPIRDALVTAARWHDKGKDRPVWQRYARNDGGVEPIAKAIRYLHPRALGYYRHEFGSLLDAMSDAAIQKHPERDLVLHLIAAHHGWARPNFEPRAHDHECFDMQANNEAATEVVRRFGQLQQRFGRWGLAWLESLLRCADIAASRGADGETVHVMENREDPA